MKRISLLVVLLAFYQISYAQCDKSITLKCAVVRNLKDGVAAQEKKMEATITISVGAIDLTISDNGQTITKESDIKEISICEWKEFMKNGRAQYKATTKGSDGNAQASIITIVSESGYTNITFGSDPDSGSKLQFDVAEYFISEAAQPVTVPGKAAKKAKKKGS